MLPNCQNTGSISFEAHGQRTKTYPEGKDRITEKNLTTLDISYTTFNFFITHQVLYT